MTQKQLERYMDDLWERHGHPDKHGYVDDMHQPGFHSALREAIEFFGVDLQSVKAPKRK